MSAKYDLYENPTPNKDEEQPKYLHPRIIPNGTIDRKMFLELVSKTNGFSPAILDGTLQAITDELYRWISEGWTVEFGELGYFSISVSSNRPVQDKKELRSPSIHFSNVNLRLSKEYRKKFTSLKLERMASPYTSHSSMNETQRIAAINQFLETHPFLSRSDYQRLVGMSKDRANQDLNYMIEKGVIKRYGKGRMTVYIK